MISLKCPVCGGTHLQECFTFKDIPVFANVTAKTSAEALQINRGNLSIVQCQHCGFVFNADFCPELVQYSQDYQPEIGLSAAYQAHLKRVASLIRQFQPLCQGNDSQRFTQSAQSASSQSTQSAQSLQSAQLAKPNIANDGGCIGSAVEIGCGTGAFLKVLRQEYGPQLSLLGVDPSVQTGVVGDIKFESSLFDESFLPKLPQDTKLIISRHMIEHIVNPLKLLQVCAKALPDDGVLYLETPRLDWILEHKTFFDFGYEHCSYFSDSFMIRLLEAANLQVISMEKNFQEQYFSICAKKRDISVEEAKEVSTRGIKPALSEELLHTAQGFTAVREACAAKARVFQATPHCCIWGCSQKGEIFLNIFDQQQECLVVDINPRKQGRFVLGTGHKILSPMELIEHKPQQILVMNAIYLDEIKEMVKQILPEQAIQFSTI